MSCGLGRSAGRSPPAVAVGRATSGSCGKPGGPQALLTTSGGSGSRGGSSRGFETKSKARAVVWA